MPDPTRPSETRNTNPNNGPADGAPEGAGAATANGSAAAGRRGEVDGGREGERGGERGGRKGDRRGRDPQVLGKLFEQLPPHSLESEMALLGAMILDAGVIGEVLMMVKGAEEFYKPVHGAIFQSILELYDRHNVHQIDLVTLVDRLRDKGVLGEIGGADYLAQLMEGVPSATLARYYARTVHEKYKLRKLIEVSGDLLYDAYNSGDLGPEAGSEVLERAELKIFEISQEWQTGEAESLGRLVQQQMDKIDDATGQITGQRTYYEDLDKMLTGLQDGEMIVVAARPSMGKTALALNLCEQIAMGGPPGARVHAKVPVALFSLEMSKASLALRLLSALSGIPMHDLRSGALDDTSYDRVFRAYRELYEAPIYIDDTAGLSITALRARARRLHKQHKVRVIMIDYLQLLTAPQQGRESRQVEVSAISRGIKALARELNIPIICLSQLNRASEDREGNKPRMSDLRESGSIEQDADVIALLHREEYYHIQNLEAWRAKNPEKVGLAELIIAKQRNGPVGTVKLRWSPMTTRFEHFNPGEHIPLATDYEGMSRPTDIDDLGA